MVLFGLELHMLFKMMHVYARITEQFYSSRASCEMSVKALILPGSTPMWGGIKENPNAVFWLLICDVYIWNQGYHESDLVLD